MALHLQVSNSLTQLANRLCGDLKSKNIPVFQAHHIVTQTEGMNNWLKFQLSENLGIAANCRFLKPNDLIHDVYSLLGGKYLQPLSAENQCWLLFKLLAEKDFTFRFRSVSDYYKEQGPDQDLKRMGLAEKIADLFDQYQIYRPEMIRQWNFESLTDVQENDWQKFLWIKAKQLSDERLPDKTLIGNFIQKALKDTAQQNLLKSKMPAVHIFGLSVTTEYHIQLFHEIGAYSDLYFHLLNPAPSSYWFEDRSEKQVAILKMKGLIDHSESSSGNSLLTSWGKVMQNTFSLLFKNDELLNQYEEVSPEEPIATTLLKQIQQDIFFNKADSERDHISAGFLEDGSLMINSCYTPAREVEVLYNYLVHLVNQRQGLSARDIVIMLSDIDTYAPYIKAVFNNAPYKFNYTIADESYTANDSIAGALKSVLLMNRENFKAEEVLQILDSGYICKRFGLTNISLIRKVVNRANIRFGMDGNKEDESVYVSWKYGLERILYGICMSGEEEYFSGTDSLYPLDMTEGTASQEVIHFCHFAQVLMDSIRERDRVRTIGEWIIYAESVLNNLVFDPLEEDDEDYNMILNQLGKYSALDELMTEELSYEVFSHTFLQSLESSNRAGSFAAGGITFCSLIPMRSIPFKIVGLLGLDFDQFPRKENPVSFSLMDKDKRKGDRNVKENDKHLFLETLLSAGDNLYISYIGQSVKDNTEIPPSALVDELLDYIQSAVKTDKSAADYLVKKHALHSFSRKYRSGDPAFYNYLEGLPVPEKEFPVKEKVRQIFDFKEVSLDSLSGFFRNPFKGYYNKVLNIYYRDEAVLLCDTELFELDHLKKWGLRQNILATEPGDHVLLRERLVKTGELPLKNMAKVIIENIETEVAPVRELFLNCIGAASERILPVDLHFEELGSRITGSLSGVYDDKLVILSWSKNERKYMLDAYIRYLAARSSGYELQLCFISAAKSAIFYGISIEAEEAKTRLLQILKLYIKGHDSILAFTPDLPFIPENVSGLTIDYFKKESKKHLFENYKYPCTDIYIMNKYNEGYFETEDTFSQYRINAEILLQPLGEMFTGYPFK